MVQQPYINTLDLDRIDKNQLESILTKIKSQSCCLGLSYKDSSTKGYHVRIDCRIYGCDKCRFVFDDTDRLSIDMHKDPKFQNITFTDKEVFKGNTTSITHYCERCEKYGKIVTLVKRDLSALKEVSEKMRIGKITEYEPLLVYLGYYYLECPVCGWFKFVKIGNYHLECVEK